LLGASLVGAAACGASLRPAPAAAPVAPTLAARTTASAEAGIVRRFVDAYNARDLEALLGLAHPDIAWLSVSGDSVSVETRGAGPLRDAMAAHFASASATRSELEAVDANGPFVSTREVARWTSPRGPRAQASIAVYEVREGRVRRVWYFPSVRR
jgi:hypothetical protein